MSDRARAPVALVQLVQLVQLVVNTGPHYYDGRSAFCFVIWKPLLQPYPAEMGVKALSGFARLRSRIRRQFDRWMHPTRHRQAKERLRLMGRPRSILVVCDGNICRSPYMAAVLQRLLPDVDVTSGGMIAPGRPVPEYAATIAVRQGLDLSSHRSRLLTREVLASAGLVVVMEPRQAAHIIRALARSADRVVVAGDLDPMSSDGRSIHDPFRQPMEVFEASYGRLARCAAILAETVSSPRPA
jgi:protein-tyrosine phosphatase